LTLIAEEQRSLTFETCLKLKGERKCNALPNPQNFEQLIVHVWDNGRMTGTAQRNGTTVHLAQDLPLQCHLSKENHCLKCQDLFQETIFDTCSRQAQCYTGKGWSGYRSKRATPKHQRPARTARRPAPSNQQTAPSYQRPTPNNQQQAPNYQQQAPNDIPAAPANNQPAPQYSQLPPNNYEEIPYATPNSPFPAGSSGCPDWDAYVRSGGSYAPYSGVIQGYPSWSSYSSSSSSYQSTVQPYSGTLTPAADDPEAEADGTQIALSAASPLSGTVEEPSVIRFSYSAPTEETTPVANTIAELLAWFNQQF
jgi:hypothetical protein